MENTACDTSPNGIMENASDNIGKQFEPPKCCFYFDTSYNRFIGLIFVILSGFFYAANYDLPGSMQNVVTETFSVTPYQFEFLYSVYTLPNIVMGFFGGLLIDKVFGLHYGSIIFGLVALFGQVVITAGGFSKLYCLLLLGRFINGIGAETVSLSLSCFCVIWFKSKELNFVFGVFMSVTRLGSSFAFLIFTPIYESCRKTLNEHLVLGVAITPFLAMSLVMVLSVAALGYFSKWNGKSVTKSKELVQSIAFKQILNFSMTFWIILIMLSICNNAVFSFISLSQQLLQSKYNLSLQQSNYLSSSFNLISAIVSMFTGLLADKVGKDLFFLMSFLFIGILSQIIMSFTMWNPWIPLIMLAIFFSVLNSCGWPIVARIVEPYQLATAYGTLMCAIDLVGTLNTILVGILYEKYGPLGDFLLFFGSLLLGECCCFLIWILDKRSKGTLNYSATQRRIINNLTK